jgi:hypothetical protein
MFDISNEKLTKKPPFMKDYRRLSPLSDLIVPRVEKAANH